jgi:hypothetical protein
MFIYEVEANLGKQGEGDRWVASRGSQHRSEPIRFTTLYQAQEHARTYRFFDIRVVQVHEDGRRDVVKVYRGDRP